MSPKLKQGVVVTLSIFLVVSAFIADVYLFPGVILPGPPFFISILIAAYFLSPRTTAGVAVFATVCKLTADLVQGSPLWLLALYFSAMVLVGIAGVALASRIRREAALAEERERYLTRLDTLMRVSSQILAQKTIDSLLQASADGARQLSGARIAIAGHGYVSGSFRIGAASRVPVPGAPSCPPGQEFKVERGGVYFDLIEKKESIRLTDQEMRSHPDWWGLPPDHGPLRGLLGVRLTGGDSQANGLLMVTDKGEGDFTIEDESLLRQLAALASLGMQHIEVSEGAERRAAELDVANKELETFSYSVSHDLRAPLRHIDGFSKILAESYADKLDEAGRQYLRFLREGSEKMEALIDALLKLSRVTQAELHRQAVNLSEIARSLLEEFRKEQPERHAELRIEPEVVANGDAQLLGIVLENLLGNAWKFTAERPVAKIDFGVTRQDDKAVYYVRDNGAGFDMAYADKLFAPFQRLHKADAFPGTGIGLATVQRIVHRHGGKIWAEGEVDKGATFYLTLG